MATGRSGERSCRASNPWPNAWPPHPRLRSPPRRSARNLSARRWRLCSRGQLPIEGRLDLHGLTQAAAADRLAKFLGRAQGEGKRCVLVITGKGGTGERPGVLREQVPRWLNQQPNRALVLAFDYARPQHGGQGALYVLLKRRRDL